MDVSIKIREGGEIYWFKSMYEQMKNKDYCNGNDIDLYKELLWRISQDVNTLED